MVAVFQVTAKRCGFNHTPHGWYALRTSRFYFLPGGER